MKKKHVVIFCGGQSSEHEVSLRSAANVFKAMDPNKFEISVIGIDRVGHWHKLGAQVLIDHQGMAAVESKPREYSELAIKMGDQKNLLQSSDHALMMNKIDVVFSVLHGPNGEDGTIQGLLRLANIPCVGSDVLGSAICMDKEVTKRLLREAGIPVVDSLVFRQKDLLDFDQIVAQLGLPFFVKPCNLGSSVGISKVKSREDFLPAITAAFSHDRKILIEKAIVGQEIECAVLGNDEPQASVVGEIIPSTDFYSYEAKYLDDSAALQIPARLPEAVAKKVQEYAVHAFKVLECCDLARVDFFVSKDHEIFLNEVNTMPGFTSISMYPRMWQASGLSYEELIEQLIEMALARNNKTQALKF
jgi:D-alanine-D-alanine ligase